VHTVLGGRSERQKTALGEVYYKRYGKQKGRFENMFNPFVLLPEMEPDRVGLNPEHAEASGLDLNSVWRITAPLSANLRDAGTRPYQHGIAEAFAALQHTLQFGAEGSFPLRAQRLRQFPTRPHCPQQPGDILFITVLLF